MERLHYAKKQCGKHYASTTMHLQTPHLWFTVRAHYRCGKLEYVDYEQPCRCANQTCIAHRLPEIRQHAGVAEGAWCIGKASSGTRSRGEMGSIRCRPTIAGGAKCRFDRFRLRGRDAADIRSGGRRGFRL